VLLKLRGEFGDLLLELVGKRIRGVDGLGGRLLGGLELRAGGGEGLDVVREPALCASSFRWNSSTVARCSAKKSKR
jgi:hypothetical protein